MDPFRLGGDVDPRQRDLLTGMGNCFEACHADFEGTVGMVARARDRTPEDVKAELAALQARFSTDPEFQRLRSRLPAAFPF